MGFCGFGVGVIDEAWHLESRGRRRLVWGKCVDKVGGSQEWGLASPVVPGVPVDGVVACLVADEGEDGVEDKEEDEAVLVREEGGCR